MRADAADMPARASRTLVVGVGSTIRGDDGVGPVVAAEVCARGGAGFEALVFDGSALDLLTAMAGGPAADRLVVIDCMATGKLAEGDVARLVVPPSDGDPGFLSSHHAGILELHAMARRLSCPLPADVRCYAVGVRDATAFREGLGDALAAAVPSIARAILKDLGAAGSAGESP